MNHALESITTVIAWICGIAALSVFLSPKATTTKVIQASASGLVNSLATAMSPVTGAHVNIVSAYPDQGFGGGLSIDANGLSLY